MSIASKIIRENLLPAPVICYSKSWPAHSVYGIDQYFQWHQRSGVRTCTEVRMSGFPLQQQNCPTREKWRLWRLRCYFLRHSENNNSLAIHPLLELLHEKRFKRLNSNSTFHFI